MPRFNAILRKKMSKRRHVNATLPKSVTRSPWDVKLAIQAEWSRAARADQLPLSVLLAVEGMRRLPSIETDQALRAGLLRSCLVADGLCRIQTRTPSTSE